ncbi:exosortase family protein XrtF [Zhouia sp. PK063]|uniref:exosortase family protein XrtF n=1 Tax=Zhouia sp. PK063 TaxID=3373602 RepID=UPI00379160CC
MKFWIKYKLAIGFILRFFGVYFVMSLLYRWYLSYYENTPDVVTKIVADVATFFLRLVGYKVEIKNLDNEPFVRLFIGNANVVTIVEGCNALSVIILFITFVIAFKGKLKSTLYYLIFGFISIYLINIIRIVLMTIGLIEIPKYRVVMHDLLFPAIIYGYVVVLWFVWVKKYANQ